jgi:hypothetical protein
VDTRSGRPLRGADVVLDRCRGVHAAVCTRSHIARSWTLGVFKDLEAQGDPVHLQSVVRHPLCPRQLPRSLSLVIETQAYLIGAKLAGLRAV